MFRVFIRLAGTLMLIAFTTVVAGVVSAQTRRVGANTPSNLTGAWALNKDLSDDTTKVMDGISGGGHGTDHVSPGGSGAGHGGGAHGGGRASGTTPEEMRAIWTRISDVLEAPAKLTIVESDGFITLTDNRGRSRRLIANDKREKRPMDNRMVEVRTKWDNSGLVNETWLDRGMKLTETFSVSSERGQLQVALKLEGSLLGRSVNLRRVYDPETRR